MNLIRQRTPSLTMAVLVLLGIVLLQEDSSYSTTTGIVGSAIGMLAGSGV
jgi:hypothetical protein